MGNSVTRWSQFILRLLVGGIFLLAGALKASDPAAFLKAIENYQIVPHSLAVATAFYLPWLEIFTGSALILRCWRRGALVLIGGMTLVFFFALLSAWVRDLEIACGCFGEGDEPIHYGWALTRNLMLLAAVAFLWRREN